MPTLRQTRSLARLVLVWFALFVAAATAGSIVDPLRLELICSGDGAVKLQAQNPDGTPAAMGNGAACPLCLLPGAPPPFASVPGMPALPVQVAVDVPDPPRRAALSLPAPPPRGPPFQPSIE